MPVKVKEMTALAVGRLREPGRYAVGGADGLHLRIVGGSRAWVLRAVVADRRRDIGLGPYPEVTDEGMWRRMRLIPFNRSFAPSERDPYLPAALWAEREHIAAWMVEGFGKYLEQGLNDVPSSIRRATEEYRSDEDVMGQWLAERTTREGDGRASELYDNYGRWCDASGHKKLSLIAFGRQVRERGFVSARTRHGVEFKGLALSGVMV